MIFTLFDVILPAFIVIAVGVWVGRAFSLSLVSLNRVALYSALPGLVFTSMSRTELAFSDTWVLYAANALFVVVMGTLAWFGSGRLRKGARRGVTATSMFGNAANMMLPVSLFAFGEAGLQRALALYVFSALLLFGLGPLMFGGIEPGAPGRRRKLVLKIATFPVLWAAVLGVAVNLLEVPVPLGVSRGVALLGEAAIPLILLTLGVQIQQAGLRAPTLVNLYGATVKLGLGPIIALATGWLVGARGLDLAILTLLGAMPPAVNNFQLAMEFGADAEEVAGTVILSTVSALATLSVIVYLLQLYLVPGVAG